MPEIASDVPRPEGLYSPADGYALLRRAVLGRVAPGEPGGASGALLSSGPDSPEWFEHRAIAEGAGLAETTRMRCDS